MAKYWMASGNSLVSENHKARFAIPRLAPTSLFLGGPILSDLPKSTNFFAERGLDRWQFKK
jgi:hypothetical protein